MLKVLLNILLTSGIKLHLYLSKTHSNIWLNRCWPTVGNPICNSQLNCILQGNTYLHTRRHIGYIQVGGRFMGYWKQEMSVEFVFFARCLRIITQKASKMLGQSSWVSSPFQNKEKRVHEHLVFHVYYNDVLNSVLQIFIWEETSKTLYIQLQVKIKRHFTKAILMPVEPFRTAPGPSKVCDSPRSELPMRAVIQVEDTLNIFLL
jgi:hypothetical protein